MGKMVYETPACVDIAMSAGECLCQSAEAKSWTGTADDIWDEE